MPESVTPPRWFYPLMGACAVMAVLILALGAYGISTSRRYVMLDAIRGAMLDTWHNRVCFVDDDGMGGMSCLTQAQRAAVAARAKR